MSTLQTHKITMSSHSKKYQNKNTQNTTCDEKFLQYRNTAGIHLSTTLQINLMKCVRILYTLL